MARPLLITAEVRAVIAESVQRARANPLSMEFLRGGHVAKTVLSLQDRKPGFERPPSEQVLIPVGYRAAYSVEEQPPGLCGHLSVSVDKKGRVPTLEAVDMIAQEFGIGRWLTMWLEEFEPGHHAVNVIGLLKPS